MPSDARDAQPAKAIAFFDVDATLVRVRTMFSFQRYYLLHTGRLPTLLGRLRWRRFQARFERMDQVRVSREESNREYYRMFEGRAVAEVRRLARGWWLEAAGGGEEIFLPGACAALQRHLARGLEVALVSGSFAEVLEPIAAALCVHTVLATRLEVLGDRYTGAILPPQVVGVGKAQVAQELIRRRGAAAGDCFAYGDHPSDAALLDAVGHPVAVSQERRMLDLAMERGWATLDPCTPGKD